MITDVLTKMFFCLYMQMFIATSQLAISNEFCFNPSAGDNSVDRGRSRNLKKRGGFSGIFLKKGGPTTYSGQFRTPLDLPLVHTNYWLLGNTNSNIICNKDQLQVQAYHTLQDYPTLTKN
jgi:hypothetical protein